MSRVTVPLRRGWAAGECFRAVFRRNCWPRRSGSRRRCSSRSEKHTRLVHTFLSYRYFFRCCESGSGIRCFLTTGPRSGISFVRIPDPTHISRELDTPRQLNQLFFWTCSKINSCRFCEKVSQIFFPFLFAFGSEVLRIRSRKDIFGCQM